MTKMLALSAIALAAIALVVTPVLAGPPVAKRPLCQVQKAPSRDVKRQEPCRKPAIPPIVDPTPLFLASTTGVRFDPSDLS